MLFIVNKVITYSFADNFLLITKSIILSFIDISSLLSKYGADGILYYSKYANFANHNFGDKHYKFN